MALWDKQTYLKETPDGSKVVVESDKAYEAFICYRDLPTGDRSVGQVSEELNKAESLLYRWSAEWKWAARCEAWDVEAQRVKDEAQQAKIRATNDAEHDLAVSLRNKLQIAFLSFDLAEMDSEDRENIKTLRELWDTVAKHDRGALGLDLLAKMPIGKSGGVGDVIPATKSYGTGVDLDDI